MPHLMCNRCSNTDFIKYYSQFYPNQYDEDFYYPNINAESYTNHNIQALVKWKFKLPFGNIEVIANKICSLIEQLNNLKNQEVIENETICSLTNDMKITRTVSKAFVFHLIKRKKYPIVDQHTFRAYNYLSQIEIEQNIPFNPNNFDRDYLNNYLQFIGSLKHETHFDLRTIDRALWIFGKLIKKMA